MESDKKSGRLKKLAGLLISIATILIIFNLTTTNVTWRVIAEAKFEFLLLAFSFHVLFWLFWALRLKLLFSFLKRTISIGYALETTIASMFLAAITPSSAGGEPARVKMLVDKGASVGSASAVIVAERLLDAVFILVALAIFILLSGFSARFGLEIGILFLALLVLCLFFLVMAIKSPQRADRLVDALYQVMKRFVKEQKAEKACLYIKKEIRLFSDSLLDLTKNSWCGITPVLLLTVAIWLSEFLVPSALLMAFKQSPFIIYSISSQLIIVIASLIPLTPGSSGVAETSMFYLYSQFVTAYLLGMLVFLWRAVTYFSNLIVGFIVTAKVLKTRY